MIYEILTDTVSIDGKYAVITGGTYDEYELVICYLIGDETKEPYCKFEAKYIINGNKTYQ